MSKFDFSEAYSLFYKRLFHISYSITRDKYLAEDVVHETFIKAIAKAETVKDERKLGAWLCAIASRTAIDFIRKEKKYKGMQVGPEAFESFETATTQNVEEEVEFALLEEEVVSAIKRLNGRYQDVLMLKLRPGLQEQEIAKVLAINSNTVKTRIYRGRRQLKQVFQGSTA
ncbi:RNA polymerase sigma factor [Bacillus spongiae]|uniref:RNA polymerase sigma factor n=1 Tax=Bacillus spongiae TaxID=2683610 RepID=A0ABU8HJB1_9BACI